MRADRWFFKAEHCTCWHLHIQGWFENSVLEQPKILKGDVSKLHVDVLYFILKGEKSKRETRSAVFRTIPVFFACFTSLTLYITTISLESKPYCFPLTLICYKKFSQPPFFATSHGPLLHVVLYLSLLSFPVISAPKNYFKKRLICNIIIQTCFLFKKISTKQEFQRQGQQPS